MKLSKTIFLLIAFCILSCSKEESNDPSTAITNSTNPSTSSTPEVNIALYKDETNATITITETTGTLSDGTTGPVYKIQTTCMAPDHEMGPFCPTNDSQSIGYWEDPNYNGGAGTKVDKAYLTFLESKGWDIVNADGTVNVTTTDAETQKVKTQEIGGWTLEQAKTSGIVNHCLSGPTSAQTKTFFYIPKYPKKATTAVETVKFPAGFGIALNGIAFFPPEPTTRIMTYQNIAPFDAMGGHTGFANDYHYHRGWDTTYNTSTKILGYAIDGFPIYGEKEPDGTTPVNLDDNKAHEHDGMGYHYHCSIISNKYYIIGKLAGVYVKV